MQEEKIVSGKFLQPRVQNTTNELKRKHQQGLTYAPLDLCLKKGLITDHDHKAANYFVFLYKLRYGKQVHLKSSYDAFRKALGITHTITIYDEAVLIRYNSAYSEIFTMFKDEKTYSLICDICVFDRFPRFLRKIQKDFLYDHEVFLEYVLFKKGLAELVKYLDRKKLLRY